MQYEVRWIIEIEADSHFEAAQIAREVQLDAGSEAIYFQVEDSTGRVSDVNLLDSSECS